MKTSVKIAGAIGAGTLAVLAAAVDAWSYATGRWELRKLNMALVWPLMHQFGSAYQRGV